MTAPGFAAAVSTAQGAASRSSDVFQLPRFTPWDRSPRRFGLRLLVDREHRRQSRALRQSRLLDELASLGDSNAVANYRHMVSRVQALYMTASDTRTTLTRDAPPEQLTLSRAKQASVAGWKRPVKAKK